MKKVFRIFCRKTGPRGLVGCHYDASFLRPPKKKRSGSWMDSVKNLGGVAFLSERDALDDEEKKKIL